jgi:ketosteroid isomerase-like protein
MSQENVEVVQRIFDGWATGDFSTEPDTFDRHVVFVVSRDFPAWGVQHGREEVRRYMRDFLAQWDRATFHAERFRAVEGTVVVDALQRSRGKASGIEGELPFFMVFTFRGRRIVRFDVVMNELEALEAVGLSEQEAHRDS